MVRKNNDPPARATCRHFTSRQELLMAVRAYALSSVAIAME
jgi:hypothetical protein